MKFKYPALFKVMAEKVSKRITDPELMDFMTEAVMLKHPAVRKISVLSEYDFGDSQAVDLKVEFKENDVGATEQVYHIDWDGEKFSWQDFGVNLDLGKDTDEALTAFKIILEEEMPTQVLVKVK